MATTRGLENFAKKDFAIHSFFGHAPPRTPPAPERMGPTPRAFYSSAFAVACAPRTRPRKQASLSTKTGKTAEALLDIESVVFDPACGRAFAISYQGKQAGTNYDPLFPRFLRVTRVTR